MKQRLSILFVSTVVMICALLLLHSPVDAQPPMLVYGNSNGTAKVIAVDSSGRLINSQYSVNDPCADSNTAKSSVAVTATGQQVALLSGNTVFLCGFYATFGGTGPTVTFQYGTGSNCGTGTVSLSGAIAPTVGNEVALGWGGTVVRGAVSNALCIALGGTTPTVAGVLTYVQQ